MTTYSEPQRPFECVLSEADGTMSRDTVTIVSGTGVLAAGTVLGKITLGSATAAAIVGTGNATTSAVTVGAGAAVGAHTLVAISATKMELFSPYGVYMGQVTTGVAAALGGLGFTVTAGGTPMVAGDTIVITVAAGSGKYATYDDDNTDGTDVAAAILLESIDATSGDVTGSVIARLAEVKSSALQWAATNDANDKTAGISDLATKYIIVR